MGFSRENHGEESLGEQYTPFWMTCKAVLQWVVKNQSLLCPESDSSC